MFGSAGEFVKVKIEACTDSTYEDTTGEEFTVMFNPENFTENNQIIYAEKQGIGTSGTQLKFDHIAPKTSTLDLIFDGTGVGVNDRGFGAAISFLSQDEPEPVSEQIARFKQLVVGYEGDDHSAKHLKVSWGSLLYKGLATDLKIVYTLFKSDGEPLRAKATLTLKESVDPGVRAAEEGKSSPDLTHVRTVLEGDTLPLMCHRIYGDSSTYMEVARINKLNNFRKLKAGTELFFPPLKD